MDPQRIARSAEPTGEQVPLNLAARDRLRASLLRQMEQVSVIVMPVCGITAFRHRDHPNLFKAMMPAVLANVLGLPAGDGAHGAVRFRNAGRGAMVAVLSRTNSCSRRRSGWKMHAGL